MKKAFTSTLTIGSPFLIQPLKSLVTNGILQQKAHTGKEMRSNSLYRFWNDQNH